MKIRKGFVGNCSSSSFVVANTAYSNVFALAKHMLMIRNEESDWANTELDKINLAELADLDKNTPVTFSTINYDTFITPTAEGYYVSTCNNTDWKEIKGIIETGGGHDDGDYRKLEERTNYWNIACGIIGTPISYDELELLSASGKISGDYCKTHYHRYIRLLDGEIICPICFAVNNGKDMMLIKKDLPEVKAIKISKPVRLR
jgi:hypothetical protein